MLTELHGTERKMALANVYAYHKTMNRCLQGFPYRNNYPCKRIPVRKYLQSRRLQVNPCRENPAGTDLQDKLSL